jgi:threonine dehydrogenase-like Zn-dependent dehydrogenase
MVLGILLWCLVLVSGSNSNRFLCVSCSDVYLGPVGLLCTYSARLRGATRVYSVDRVPLCLEKARSIGDIPIDFSRSDPVAQTMKLEPNGVDRSCDCVGFECVDATGRNVEHLVVNWAVNVTSPYGGIGLIGVYFVGDLSKYFTSFWFTCVSILIGFEDLLRIAVPMVIFNFPLAFSSSRLCL